MTTADIWSRVKTEGMTPMDLRMIESEEFLSMENPNLLFLEDGTKNLHSSVPGSRLVSEQNQVPGSGVVVSESRSYRASRKTASFLPCSPPEPKFRALVQLSTWIVHAKFFRDITHLVNRNEDVNHDAKRW
ncbi:hypothetical protein ACFE04_011972 [Oxalis oulophora]